MFKKIIISALAAVLVTAIGFSVYNVLAKGEMGTQAAVENTQNLTTQAMNTSPAAASQEPENQPAAVAPSNATGDAVEQQAANSAALNQPAVAQPSYQANQTFSNGQGGQGRGGSSGSSRGQGRWGQSQNSQGQSNSAQSGSGVPAPQNGLNEWITLQGVVSSYAPPSLVLQTVDGQSIMVEVGNQNYLSSLGANLTAGESITIIGFYDQNGGFTVGALTLDSSGQSFTLRDELGRPAWRGGK